MVNYKCCVCLNKKAKKKVSKRSNKVTSTLYQKDISFDKTLTWICGVCRNKLNKKHTGYSSHKTNVTPLACTFTNQFSKNNDYIQQEAFQEDQITDENIINVHKEDITNQNDSNISAEELKKQKSVLEASLHNLFNINSEQANIYNANLQTIIQHYEKKQKDLTEKIEELKQKRNKRTVDKLNVLKQKSKDVYLILNSILNKTNTMRRGKSNKTKKRNFNIFKQVFNLFFPNETIQTFYLWNRTILQDQIELYNEHEISAACDRFLSKSECVELQRLASLSDDQFDIINQYLSKKNGSPFLYCSKSLVDIKKQQQKDIVDQLQVKEMENIGVEANIQCVLRWIINLYDCKESKSLWKFMLDGRPKCNKSEVMIGITPLSFGLNPQSCNFVFPVIIFPGEETGEVFNENITKFINSIEDTISNTIQINNRDHKINWIHVSDLKALWSLSGLAMGECPFCNCSSVSDRTIVYGASTWITFTRKLNGKLLNFPIRNIGICALHMKLRTVDMYMRIIAQACKGTSYEIKLRQIMNKIDVPFDYHKRKKGSGWRLPSYRGNQANKIIKNNKEISSCWPDSLDITLRNFSRAELIKKIKEFNIELPAKKDFRNCKNEDFRKILAPKIQRNVKEYHQEDRIRIINMWDTIFEMYSFVNTGYTSITDIEENWYIIGNNLIEEFVDLHLRSDFRIYTHILLSHGLDLFYRFGPLNKISNQGFEAANKRDIINFHKHSQRNGGLLPNSLNTLLKKRKRENKTLEKMIALPYINATIQPLKKRKIGIENIVYLCNIEHSTKFVEIKRKTHLQDEIVDEIEELDEYTEEEIEIEI